MFNRSTVQTDSTSTYEYFREISNNDALSVPQYEYYSLAISLPFMNVFEITWFVLQSSELLNMSTVNRGPWNGPLRHVTSPQQK